jgi:uncharacterized membrane protein YfcA
MTTGYIAAAALALLIGFLLGSMGSGGSILTLPVLVYVAGVAPQSAVPMSLAIVGTTSVLAAYLHARRDNFNLKAALLLGATGMIGAYLGSAGTHLISSRTLMLIFAGLLLVVGIVMFRGSVAGLPPGICRPLRCLTVGAVVGVLTGFLGVGGGFLIVPALVLFAGLDTKMAIGTSLAIIALNSAAGLVGQVRYAELDWTLTTILTGAAFIGMLLGLAAAGRLSEETSRKAFASLLLVVGLVIAGVNV